MSEQIKDDRNGKKGSLFKIILIIILIFILVAGSAFAGFFIASKNAPTQKVIVEQSADPKNEAFFELDEFLVNLADEGTPRYLKMKITLGYDGENTRLQKELEQKKPKMRDIISNSLRTKKTTDVDSSNEKPIKDELLQKINNTLTEGRVINIYFPDSIIQ